MQAFKPCWFPWETASPPKDLILCQQAKFEGSGADCLKTTSMPGFRKRIAWAVWEGLGFSLFRGDAKPDRYYTALEKPLQKSQVSLAVQGLSPAVTEHPSLWPFWSSQHACSFSQQGFFQKQQLQPWHSGQEGKQYLAPLGTGSADRLMSSVNLRLSSLVYLSGMTTTWGDRCYMRGL